MRTIKSFKVMRMSLFLDKVLCKATDIWSDFDEYIVIGDEVKKVVLNAEQSVLWRLMDDTRTQEELIEEYSKESPNLAGYAHQTIEKFITIGIAYYVDGGWDD